MGNHGKKVEMVMGVNVREDDKAKRRVTGLNGCSQSIGGDQRIARMAGWRLKLGEGEADVEHVWTFNVFQICESGILPSHIADQRVYFTFLWKYGIENSYSIQFPTKSRVSRRRCPVCLVRQFGSRTTRLPRR
jgi:hypothetical protein